MNAEQQLIEKWRNLPFDKQQQVLQFVESLDEQQPKQTKLSNVYASLRAKIVMNGEPLLNKHEIEQEIISRRGGLQNIGE